MKTLFNVLVVFTLLIFQNITASPEKFYNINSLLGTSLREVNSVCNDNKGFIWASSKFGILRITEDDHRIYQLPYSNSNVISLKLVYNYSKLVAYTNNGQIFLYNPIYDRFEMFVDLTVQLKKKYVYLLDVFIDSSGTFWFASTNGIYCLRSGQFSISYEFRKENYVLVDYDDNRFLMVQNEGLVFIDKHRKQISPLYSSNFQMPLLPSSVFFDKDNQRLWVGTMSNGLYIYDFDKKMMRQVLESVFPRQPILAIEKNSASTVLIGVDGQGIWELDNSGKQVLSVLREQVNDPSSLKGNGVYDLYCDANKRVWVCTYSGGLSFFDQATPLVSPVAHQINNPNSLANNDVNGIIEDKSGKIWFATNNGISCWDVTANKWVHLLNDMSGQARVFLSLCEDDQGQIWAGSYSAGVYVIDSKSYRNIAHYSRDEKGKFLVSNFILHIFKDREGDIWLGGVNGEFCCFQAKTQQFRTYNREPINVFEEISAGQLLLGCSYGLIQLDKQRGSLKYLYMNSGITDIFVLGNDLWLCTDGEGLVKFNYPAHKSEVIDVNSGLPSNYVKSIEYSDNYLWVGTENGLCRVNPKDNSVVSYASNYLLSRSSFNKTANYKLKNGKLAWGTNMGALFFNPAQVQELPAEGKIFFQDLLVSGRSVRDTQTYDLQIPVDSLKSVRLNHNQNTINLELIPIKITAGAKLSWFLEGFDKEWNRPSDNRMVIYTNIPTGDYELKIRMYDSSLSHLIDERTLSIEVVPPFWKKTWFWLLVYIILLGLALLVLKYYVKSIRQKHTEEKVRFFTNTAHDIRTSLTLIKAPVEELSNEPGLSESGQYYLKLAIEQVRHLAMVITQLMDFQKADIGKDKLSLTKVEIVKFIGNRFIMFDSFAKTKNINITFSSNISNCFTFIDEAKIEKVIDNLISNAIKYSPNDSQIQIILQCNESQWVLEVKDKGIGINKEAQRHLFKEFYRGENAVNSKVVGSGIGLLLVKNYIALHNGKISCQSTENEGSTFRVAVPVVNNVNAASTNLSKQVTNSNNSTPQVAMPRPVVHHAESKLKDMKVLVAEDNDDLLRFMQNKLNHDFDVYTATDGNSAWELIKAQLPDVVITDVMMPEMDGFELCKRIKSTYETSHIPVILLTALSDNDAQMHGLGLGADDYVTKPFDMNILQHRIRNIIRNREIIREKTFKVIRGETAESILNNELNEKFMTKVLEVAKANIANSEFSKDDFAAAMNVSASLLYKKIKSLTNLSPTDFIKTVRLEHALELLQSRQHSVTEVSEICGFTSVGYFSTVFRKHFGKSPTDILE
jgi:signal transduction histidine kinase/DNA-binding response OmpR family regulator/ligand-binding sensor domain-containing protein